METDRECISIIIVIRVFCFWEAGTSFGEGMGANGEHG